MRAVVLERVGGPERGLAVRDVAEPAVSPGLTPVRVRAAGVSGVDVDVCTGRRAAPLELPWIPGLEVAGETDDGRRVIALLPDGGGYAETVAVDEGWLFDLPESVPFEEGAAFLQAFLTAWIPLTRQADVRAGRRVLVAETAAEVGSAAVQVARLLGAEVVSPEDLADADEVDAAFATGGGHALPDVLERLRPLGAAIVVGSSSAVETRLLVERGVGLHGFDLARLTRASPELVREAASDLLRMWSLGLLRPVVSATLPLEQAAEAHRLVEERGTAGKVVLLT